jgi:hypothetical protein
MVIGEKVLNITPKFSADYQSGQDNSGFPYSLWGAVDMTQASLRRESGRGAARSSFSKLFGYEKFLDEGKGTLY